MSLSAFWVQRIIKILLATLVFFFDYVILIRCGPVLLKQIYTCPLFYVPISLTFNDLASPVNSVPSSHESLIISNDFPEASQLHPPIFIYLFTYAQGRPTHVLLEETFLHHRHRNYICSKRGPRTECLQIPKCAGPRKL